MHNSKRNIVLMIFMVMASVIAFYFHPTYKIADHEVKIDLNTIIPKTFGSWVLVQQQPGQIVNPQQKEILDRIYTQTLSRTYLNANGDLIMLSIAYGEDQSDAKQLHYPEVCYPAQGFQIKSTSYSTLLTDHGSIPVKRLVALNGQRSEPLTYWTTIGKKVVLGSKESKIEQVRYGFKGLIPDGLIFRVSTITEDIPAAYQLEADFVSSLVDVLPPDMLPRITGLSRGVPN